MKRYWLHQQGNSSAILFMAGWGMDPSPFLALPTVTHDVLLGYDYNTSDPADILSELKPYTSVHLLAWSMGVWIASKYLIENKEMFISATAVNGTLFPIDDSLGIPAKPFDSMLDNFSPQTLESFYRDMFDDPQQVKRFLETRPKRSLESIKSELKRLLENYRVKGPGQDIFSQRIVSSRDRIFPARGQLRSWEKKKCEKIQGGHFPFYNWSSLDAFIDGGLQGNAS